MKSLYGKVAIVTGSSRGIGAEIALTLANAGARVVINYVQNKLSADEVCAAISSAGGECIAVQADVSNSDEVRKLFDATSEHFKQIDILVNNAGILLFKEIAEIRNEEFDRIVDVNFKSVFYTLREAATRLADYGRVVKFRVR